MTEHVSARSNNLPFCELITLQESSVKEKILQYIVARNGDMTYRIAEPKLSIAGRENFLMPYGI